MREGYNDPFKMFPSPNAYSVYALHGGGGRVYSLGITIGRAALMIRERVEWRASFTYSEKGNPNAFIAMHSVAPPIRGRDIATHSLVRGNGVSHHSLEEGVPLTH